MEELQGFASGNIMKETVVNAFSKHIAFLKIQKNDLSVV